MHTIHYKINEFVFNYAIHFMRFIAVIVLFVIKYHPLFSVKTNWHKS